MAYSEPSSTSAATTHDRADEHEHSADAETHGIERVDMIRIAVVAAGAVVVWLLPDDRVAVAAAVGLVVTTIGGWPILREAVENLLERRMTMELSMTIALVAALVVGEFFVALVITLFVLIAEVLEGLTVARGRHAIQDLLRYLPRTALVRRGEERVEVPVAELAAGDLVLVNPGSAIAVDGTVISGSTHVDEATITGEPMPVAKSSGDAVFAGTVNQSGLLEVRAERVGRDSTFGKIVEAVERAEHSRAPVQRLADRLAGYLVYFALGSAAITFALTRDVQATISVIIVAGACGIAAGTPLAILGGVGRAARQGAIVKGGLYLETLSTVDTVVFDKTGTLTYGTPRVRSVVPLEGVEATELVRAAAIAEARSEHPLAKAIREHALTSGIDAVEPDGFDYQPGRGVVASAAGADIVVGTRSFLESRGLDTADLGVPSDASASEVVVASEGRLLGSIFVADEVRPEAAEAVRDLRAMGVRTVLLSGDRPEAAESTARRLGVDDHAGGLLPDEKVARIQDLVRYGGTVAMVGDGVNDAPALAQANVGIAMGSGTDVSRESAHVVLIGNDLAKLVEVLRISRRTRRVIKQNFIGTIGVDLAGIALAAFGLLGPLVAVFIHVASELLFILNSARLLPAPTRGNDVEAEQVRPRANAAARPSVSPPRSRDA